MHSKVYIISSGFTDAAIYAYDFVFYKYFGVEVELKREKSSIPEGSILISHDKSGVENSIFVEKHNLLTKSPVIGPSEVEIGNWDDLATLFPKKGDIPFDVFSAVFYLLARVEEYQTSRRDKHGRFEWKSSILSKPEFRGKPIIDLWLKKFGELIEAKFPQFQPKERKLEWINTFDIDIAYAYTHRSPLRVLGATAKNVVEANFNSVLERTKVILKKYQDPFDTFAYQEEVARTAKCQTIYFFLLGSGGSMDRNISPENKKFQNLIRHTKEYAEVGIHPSYLSVDKPSELAVEVERLEGIIDEPVTRSRQHFLRMSLPRTYRRLLKEGITSDYTMGYAEQLGFRSGTCTPHYFFDIEEDNVTSLKIYPLTVMEGTLRDYLKLNPDQAKEAYRKTIASVNEVGGTFISLWHNDSLKTESPWRGVYQFMVDELNELITQ